MGLKEQLMQDYKDAMKSADALKKNTVNMVRAAIKQYEVDQRVKVASEILILALEGALSSTDVLQFNGYSGIALLQLLFEAQRSVDQVGNNVDQSNDCQTEKKLYSLFHFLVICY
jgi:hypothetical protein